MDDGGRRTGRTGLLKVKRPLNTDSLCGHYQCREKELLHCADYFLDQVQEGISISMPRY